MKLNMILPVIAISVGAMTPTVAQAQAQGSQAARAENTRATNTLKARVSLAQDRIAAGQRSGNVARTRAGKLNNEVSQVRENMTRLSRRQGFVSAAELASYNRTLDAIDTELDRRGVERSYGNDALPSAEMIAFRKVDARLRYREARLEYDAKECAMYQGKAPNGQVRRERLLSEAGRPFCTGR
ncbi:hypothetical protein [Sphingomonas sp. S-NIH.Pt15_0812]|uniref:hypothetical protein n=1 Tax=Sphingomonas sp. S-NIH.Pt15_0812 TaxID=1920129 RepID=UPI000F7DEBCB|nr:hypothetical protein [Sphingomonas sp. S-NIH.Pt15_0812]RSU45463.1 hypothetical protein BRX43_18805 [Sphingomonas sp. S-NIH.Pt15_0812]